MEENDGHERDGQPPSIHMVWGLASFTSLEEFEGERKRRELEASTKKDVYVELKIHRPSAAALPPPAEYAPPPPPNYGVTKAKKKRDHGPKRK